LFLSWTERLDYQPHGADGAMGGYSPKLTMRVLIIGGTGMLGHKLCQLLSESHETFATFRREVPDVPAVFGRIQKLHGVDVLDFETVRRTVADVQPDVVVNSAGIVKQHPVARDPIRSITVNSLFPHQLSALCQSQGALLIHISTDCVFSGETGLYTEDNLPDPVDLYGRSKLLGEVGGPSALTLRTSIIGRELDSSLGLVEWFLGQRGRHVSGYTNAIFSGLTTAALGRVIERLITGNTKIRGLWHVSAAPISKHELLVALNERFGAAVSIEPDPTVKCDRSLVSDRFCSATGLTPPTWTEMINELSSEPAYVRGNARA
jgi:dTDP-4-dehydrorhamnose reductase